LSRNKTFVRRARRAGSEDFESRVRRGPTNNWNDLENTEPGGDFRNRRARVVRRRTLEIDEKRPKKYSRTGRYAFSPRPGFSIGVSERFFPRRSRFVRLRRRRGRFERFRHFQRYHRFGATAITATLAGRRFRARMTPTVCTRRPGRYTGVNDIDRRQFFGYNIRAREYFPFLYSARDY